MVCWPFNFIPFTILPGFSLYQENVIKEQIGKINKNTCLRWSDMNESERHKNLKSFVRFERGAPNHPCETKIFFPRVENPLRVDITLADHCFEGRFVLHEIVHALGFDHEQKRLDRDCYVWVRESSKEHFSNKIDIFFSIPNVDTFPYDKLSVTHYRRSDDLKALSERFYEWEPLGNKEERLTELDLWKIQYRFCDRPHYCEVHPDRCREMEKIESEKKCSFAI